MRSRDYSIGVANLGLRILLGWGQNVIVDSRVKLLVTNSEIRNSKLEICYEQDYVWKNESS